MAKRKPKYYAAQLGGSTNFNWSIPEDNSPSVVNQTATGASDIYGNKYFTPDNTGTPTTNNPNIVPLTGNKKNIWDILGNTNKTQLHPAIQSLNAGMQTVTGIANMVNDVKSNQYEKDQYLRAITPKYYENMEGYGLNANPVLTQYGGSSKYQTTNTTKGKVVGKVIMNDGKNAAIWNPQIQYTQPVERDLDPSVVKDSENRVFLGKNRYKVTNTARDRDATEFTQPMGILEYAEHQSNIPTPKYSSLNLAQPTKFSATYMDASSPSGQKSIYFQDRNAWRNFMNTGALGGVDTSETANSASATGYRTMQTGGDAIEDYDSYYEMNAQLAHYKNLINEKLKAKNPKAFSDYFSGLRDLRVKGDQGAVDKYIQESPYNEYLTPDEVRKTLGEADYGIYSNYLNASKPKLAGDIEGLDSYDNLNYGRRFASLPFSTSYSINNTTKGTSYRRDYTYNPKTALTEWSETGDTSIRPKTFRTEQRKPMTAEEEKALLTSIPSRKNGGTIPKTYGVGNKSIANVEAERGEVVQNLDGSMDQVATDANTHEQGGVFLPDVHRVLENTSNIRKDKTSKSLKLSPEVVKSVTGADVRGSVSHAEALVKANDYYEGERNKITKKIELATKNRNELDKYGELSTKLNVQQFTSLPTQEQLFENLFNHQEAVKSQYGIKTGQKAQLGGYTGNKSGLKTPAGNSDAFPVRQDYNFQNYLEDLTGKGFKYEGITNPKDFQLALYDYQLKNNPDAIKKMWGEGMHQKGMQQAQKLGLIDAKGNFKQGALDSPDNLQKLRDIYADGILGVRTMNLTKNPKPPRIWSDDEIPAEEVPQLTQELDTSITPPNIVQQPRSKFNEPLRWYDVASPVNAYMAALERDPGKYNPMEFNQLRYKLLDPTAALQQNQADFNAGTQAVQNMSANNPGAGMANIANLSAQKYAANNQVLGNYENQNAQIKNNEITYNTQVRDKNSLADQQAREVFENKVLTSKAIQQEQKLTAMDSLYKTIAENRALNRNGNLIMKFSRAFDQYGEYNGYKPIFGVNPALGVPQLPTTGAAGGIQQLAPGKNYYNRKTGKTLYFDGVKLVERK